MAGKSAAEMSAPVSIPLAMKKQDAPGRPRSKVDHSKPSAPRTSGQVARVNVQELRGRYFKAGRQAQFHPP